MPREKLLRECVAAVNAQISSSDVPRSITQKEGNGTHEILGSPHLAHWNQRGPFVTEIRIFVQDLASAV